MDIKTIKILLVEDEVKLANSLKLNLEANEFEVEIAFDGLIAKKLVKNNEYDCILLDINLPNVNGYDLCKFIREFNPTVPIIMLTALGELEDKLDAFNLGADDYIVKPFHSEELIAKIKVFIKRKNANVSNITFIKPDLEINSETKKASRGTTEIELTHKEFALLLYLTKTPGKVISKHELSEKVWDIHFDTGTNTVEVYINFLRNKIDKGHDYKYIMTKIGHGYYIKVES